MYVCVCGREWKKKQWYGVCARVKDIDSIAYRWESFRMRENKMDHWENWEQMRCEYGSFLLVLLLSFFFFINLFHFRFILRNIEFLSTKKRIVCIMYTLSCEGINLSRYMEKNRNETAHKSHSMSTARLLISCMCHKIIKY